MKHTKLKRKLYIFCAGTGRKWLFESERWAEEQLNYCLVKGTQRRN